MTKVSESERTAIERIEARAAEDVANDKKRKRKRAVIAGVVFGTLFVAALTALIIKFVNDDGWRDVTVNAGAAQNCSSSFAFRMKLDRKEGGRDYRMLTQAYTDATVRDYAVFDTVEPHEGIAGMYALNTSAGEAIRVEPELYHALELMDRSGFRGLYLGPVYEIYQDLFLSENDSFASELDPLRNEDTAAFVKNAVRFASDPDEVSLELLGENRVRLTISDAYRAFAEEYGFNVFLDFFWMKNAFILDDLKEKLSATGYTKGYLVSTEGFAVCLDTTEEIYEMIMRDRIGRDLFSAARFEYRGPISIVGLHDYPTADTYGDYYYMYDDGTFVTPYIDPKDGLCKSSIHDLVFYSKTAKTAELLLSAVDLMIADVFDEAKAAGYAKKGSYPVYCKEKEVVVFGDGFLSIKPDEGYTLREK
ncbi:MAG: hypothetical protein IK088_00160 [Lachnospiraceae bacterium]|nr:hypothetical protein [Lachnospiraceae bacterium]